MKTLGKILGGSMVAVLFIGLLSWVVVPELMADVTYRIPFKSGLTIGDILYAVDGSAMTRLAAGTSGHALVSNGAAAAPSYRNVGAVASSGDYVFLSAVDGCVASTGYAVNTASGTVALAGMVASRSALNDWSLARNSVGIELYNINCPLNSWLQHTGATKGVRIDSLDFVYQVAGGTAFATHATMATRIFASGSANTIGSNLLTASAMTSGSQTQPMLTNMVVTTPTYQPANVKTDMNVEVAVQMAATSTYRFYGIGVNYTRLDH